MYKIVPLVLITKTWWRVILHQVFGHRVHNPLRDHSRQLGKSVEYTVYYKDLPKTFLYANPSIIYIPIHSNSQETENGAHKRHAQQGVHHIIQLLLWGSFLLQLSYVSKQNHQGLAAFGEAGDGVEGCQAADEAVHGRVEVPVPNDGHHNQQVLGQAHCANDEKDWDRDLNLRAVRLVRCCSIHG